MKGELMLRCDVCGKLKPESQVLIQYDKDFQLYYICMDCIKKYLKR